MTPHALIPISDNSSIGEARRTAIRMADLAKLSQTDAGRASIVATELATNLLRHANPAGRALLVGIVENPRNTAAAVEITSIDAGPGMGDVGRCFEDGYSTGGTPGNGLGAVRRLSNEHDLFTAPSGTVLWCRVGPSGASTSPPSGASASPYGLIRIGAISVPAPLETLCGDAWRLLQADDHRMAVMLADGLGHGPLAADAAAEACKSFNASPFADPAVVLTNMHAAISATRGAAVAVGQIDFTSGKLSYAGVGNIAGTLLAPDASSRGLFSHNGTVGHLVRRTQVFDYPMAPGGILILHSDGIQTRWTLTKYAGLARRHPAVIAGVLFRDFRRGRDDATVVVIESPRTAT